MTICELLFNGYYIFAVKITPPTRRQQLDKSVKATNDLTNTSKDRNDILQNYYLEKLKLMKENNDLKKRENDNIEEKNNLTLQKIKVSKQQNRILENIGATLIGILKK